MVIIKKLLLIASFVFFAMNVPAAFAHQNIVADEAQLFQEEDITKMGSIIASLSDQFQMNIFVVTVNEANGLSSSEIAHEFYESAAQHTGGTKDGILFLLNMDEREVYIYTRDRVDYLFPPAQIEATLDDVYSYLVDEEYAASVFAFLEHVEHVMQAESNLNDGTYYAGATATSITMQEILLYVVIALALGGVVVAIMAYANKGQKTVTATTYLQRDSFAVTKRIDRHYNTIVTSQKIANTTNSGPSGGGTRIGGGGRKF